MGEGWARTGNETLEEGLVAQVGVMLLKVLFGGGHELDGDELVAGRLSVRVEEMSLIWVDFVPSPLKALDDLADEATL